MLDVILLY